MSTTAVSPQAAARTQACLKAVNGIDRFLREVLTPQEITKLNVPHHQTIDVAQRLYDCFATNSRVIVALATVKDTDHCHIAVFVAAIRQMTEVTEG